MDSSPTTSPSTSRFFSTLSSGPPKRTYAKSRGVAAQTRNRASEEQLAGDEEEDDEAISVRSSPRHTARDTSPSPTPTNRRSSSRLGSGPSRTTSRPTAVSRASSELTAPPKSDTREAIDTSGETVAETLSSRRRIDGRNDEAMPVKIAKEEKKRKRASDLESTVFASSRRITRSGTNSAASIPSTESTEEVERPKTPPPQASSSSSTRQAPRTPPRSVRQALPTTPTTSSPRDFAGLFAAVSPGGTTDRGAFASPRAAKILGKSQSSGAVLDSPSKLKQRFDAVQRQESFGSGMSPGPSTPSKRLGKTQSMPETPSRGSGSPAVASTDPDPSAMLVQPTIPEGQGSGGRAKRVYGRTRTVIAEERETSQEAPTLEEALSKESYADLRKRYEVDAGSTDVSADLLSGALAARPPESVNDMRSKGGNRRYMDETGYLLDGIIEKGASKAFKKSSSVDLLSNMLQDEWLTKMKTCGQTERVWAALSHARGNGDDGVMYAVCLMALYIIVLSGDGIETIIRADADNCVNLLLDELEQRNGILDPSSKVKKTPIVIRVREIGQELSERTSRPIVTRSVASAVLAAICQPGILQLAKEALETSRAAVKVSKAIKLEAGSIDARFALYEHGLTLLPPNGSLDMCRLKNQISVILALVLSTDSAKEDLSSPNLEVGPALQQALVAAVALGLQPDSPDAKDAVITIGHIIKIFLNMIEAIPTWIIFLMDRGALNALGRIVRHRARLSALAFQNTEGEDSAGVGEHELLSLALAVLAFASFKTTGFAFSLAMLYLAPDCVNRAGCLRLCYCVAAEPFPFYLVELHKDYEEDMAIPERSVVGSYTGLLLAKIIISASPHTDDIITKLPGDTRTEKLEKLVASLNRLKAYMSTKRSQVGGTAGGGTVDAEDEEVDCEEGDVILQAIADLELIIDP